MDYFTPNIFYPLFPLLNVKKEMNRVPMLKCEKMLMGGGVNPYVLALQGVF
jgi:hypothetical protein